MADEQSRKEINKKLAKPLALTAGILGLVQGLAWTVFSILCICSYAGSIEIDALSPNETEYYKIIYIIFLEANSISAPNVIITPRNFLIFNCFYLILSVSWACLSGSIVWAMIHDKWNLSKPLFGAWSVTTILISIVDIVLAGLLIADYVKLNNRGSETTILVCYGIVMSLAARGYVLWIINIVFGVIMMKFTINIILRENKASTSPIIYGYDPNDNTSPSWLNNPAKDFWDNPQSTPKTNDGYDNHGFARSQSFFPAPIPNGTSHNAAPTNLYNATPNNIYNAPPNNLYNTTPNNLYNATPNNLYNATPNRAPVSAPTNNPTSFSEAIANRTATIGKNKGRRSPLNHVSPPVIPDPDYTPPHSPNGLKSVLRSKSHY